MPGPARKRVYEESQTPVEKHDSVFLSPLVLFKRPAYNRTFQDFTITKVPAIPADEKVAQTYTFQYNGQQYGLLKMNEAKLEADVQIVDTTTGNGYGNNYNVGLIPFILRTMWKSKEVQINHQLVNSLTAADHIVAWLRHLTTETKKAWYPSRKLNIGMHDTAGYFDHVAYQNTTVDHSTHADYVQDKNFCRNYGLRERSHIFNNGAEICMIDDLDTVCFNENGSNKYFPTDFDIRVILHRNPPNKYIRGPIGPTGGNNSDTTGVNTADIALRNFSLVLPMFKPNDQLSLAINKSMVGNDEECIFYTSHYRIVPLAVPTQARYILFQDIFNGARPTRVFFNLMTQQRWNGGFGTVGVANDYDGTNANVCTNHFNTLANNNGNHPLCAICPDFSYVALRINQQIVQPEYRKQEAYMEWRRMLNRQYDDMPFDYDEFLTDYGWLCFDLSENKDSFNEVLPNSTTGNVSIEINLEADLPNAAHQLVCVAEFRNEVKIGYNTPARKMLDY